MSDPSEIERIWLESFGIAPTPLDRDVFPSTIIFSNTPKLSTSTLMIDPGSTGLEFAGVPVRIKSPLRK